MNRILFSACCAILLCPLLAVGQTTVPVPREEPDDHAHGDLTHEDARHRPNDTPADAHAGHAHPGVDLSHPIVTESPLPETKLRLNYFFGNGGEGKTHAAELEVEYAFVPWFSIEAAVPYLYAEPDDGPAVNGFGDAALAFKFASYAFVDHHFFPAAGVEFGLPTGDEADGLGSDHVLEVEPFARLGYWAGRFEFIGSVSLGVPLNQTDDEADEEDFGVNYGVSALYHVLPDLQLLTELNGGILFGDGTTHELYLSPGITFQPLEDKSVNFGIGVSLPLTNDREFDYAINVMSILHF